MKPSKSELVYISQELIKTKSVSSNISENTKAIKRIVSFFSTLQNNKYHIDIITINNKPSVIITNTNSKEFDIILSGHVDVVPVENDNQYEPIIKDGYKLRGRGSADMKSSVAIMIKVMYDLLEQEYQKKTIALIINTDEEIGGFDGAKRFADNGYKAKVVLCPDGGSINEIVYAEKGIMQLSVKSVGERCHASKRRLGSNAISKVLSFYEKLQHIIEESDLDCEEKGYWTSTVNLTNIHGGVGACNVIPNSAEGFIDIRFTEKFTLQSLKSIIDTLSQESDIAYNIIVSGDALYSDPSSNTIQTYLKIAKQYCGESTHLIKEHCACDARFFGAQGAIVILQQPNRNDIHGVDERVDTNDFEKLYNTFYHFILQV